MKVMRNQKKTWLRSLMLSSTFALPSLSDTHQFSDIITVARFGLPIEFVSMPMPGAGSPATLAGSNCSTRSRNIKWNYTCPASSPRGSGNLRRRTSYLWYENRDNPHVRSRSNNDFLRLCTNGQVLWASHSYLCSPVRCKIVDAQAGFETALSGLLASLAGINIISGAGILDL